MRQIFAILLSVFPVAARAQNSILFSQPGWQLVGDAKVSSDQGAEILTITNGQAFRPDLKFEDGTIDVEVKTSTVRSFVYVMFRMKSEDELEEFYLRPHKSTLPDAAQYAPVFQRQSAWQLYHGATGTAAPRITPNVWAPLRVVLSGRRAAFFLGDTIKPFMVVQRLVRDPEPGYLALRAFTPPPGAGPTGGASAQYRNLRVRPGIVTYDFGSQSAEQAEFAGLIKSWSAGKAFAAPDSALSVIDPEWVREMKPVQIEPQGFVELHRHVELPKNARIWGTVARVTVTADNAGTKRLDLGFSDRATVFLNGAPVFYRDDSYDYEARRDGLISLRQASVYLPLKAGRNDISIVVTDRFGGWAIMGAFPDMTGLSITR